MVTPPQSTLGGGHCQMVTPPNQIFGGGHQILVTPPPPNEILGEVTGDPPPQKFWGRSPPKGDPPQNGGDPPQGGVTVELSLTEHTVT